MSELLYIQNNSAENLARLVEEDVTYSVLYTILHRKCEHIFTNNSSVIICHSNPPYPVWVWCKDANNTCDIQAISDVLSKYFPLNKGYNIIIADDTLSALSKINSDFQNYSVKMELFAYRLDKINEISYNFKGQITFVKESELDVVAKLWQDACYEMELIHFDIEFCKNEVSKKIKNNTLYCLKTEDGEFATLVSKEKTGEYSKISTVYTLPHLRRKGYAINLVHYVTKTILDENLIPILYTNGGYSPSNECYKKIGYYQVGRIFNIQK